jgi:hypothetical protein
MPGPYATLWHTRGSCDPGHPDEEFSPDDIDLAKRLKAPSYVGTPIGAPEKDDSSQSHPVFGGGDSITALVLGIGSCAYSTP